MTLAHIIDQIPPGQAANIVADIEQLSKSQRGAQDSSGSINDALAQFFTSNLTLLSDSAHRVLLTPHSHVPNAAAHHWDPVSGQVYKVDHVAPKLSPVAQISLRDPLLARLNSALDAYTRNHYHGGVCAVYPGDVSYPQLVAEQQKGSHQTETARSPESAEGHKESPESVEKQKESTAIAEGQKESLESVGEQKESTAIAEGQKESTAIAEEQKESLESVEKQKESPESVGEQKEFPESAEEQKESPESVEEEKEPHASTDENSQETTVTQEDRPLPQESVEEQEPQEATTQEEHPLPQESGAVPQEENTTTKDAAPVDTTTQDATPSDATPLDTTTQDAAPVDTTTQDVTPSDATPNDALPEDTACSHAADFLTDVPATAENPVRESSEQEHGEPAEQTNSSYVAYLTGEKLNPGNFWTGRWNATYTIDLDAATVEGSARILAHYFEHGNIQMESRLSRKKTFVWKDGDVAPIVQAVKRCEEEIFAETRDRLCSLSQDGLRRLRRALPVTRSRIDWDKLSAMRMRN